MASDDAAKVSAIWVSPLFRRRHQCLVAL